MVLSYTKSSKQKKESLLKQRKLITTLQGDLQTLSLRKEMHLGTEQLLESLLVHASFWFILGSCSVHLLKNSLPQLLCLHMTYPATWKDGLAELLSQFHMSEGMKLIVLPRSDVHLWFSKLCWVWPSHVHKHGCQTLTSVILWIQSCGLFSRRNPLSWTLLHIFQGTIILVWEAYNGSFSRS